MEHYLITIDSGTTNTRVALWNQKKACVDIYKSEIGVRVTAVEGNNKRLAGAIREGIQTLLNRNNLTIHQIASVYASGMITSNVGLTEVPHIEAPAGLEDFAAAVRAVLIPEVFELPIPGPEKFQCCGYGYPGIHGYYERGGDRGTGFAISYHGKRGCPSRAARFAQ